MKIVNLALLVMFAFMANVSLAGGGHDHHGESEHDEHEEEKGPNGGRLLKQDDFELEVTIYENGIPAEMRIYAYHDEELISPEKYEVHVSLIRLGGEKDHINFTAENDYLVGDTVIREPHSYEVQIHAHFEDHEFAWEYESFEGRTQINDRLFKLSNLETENAKQKTLTQTQTLFGVITTPEDQVFSIHAPFVSMVKKVHVNLGDNVLKGQTLLTLQNVESLQTYSVKSPSNGVVSERAVNIGDKVTDQQLLQIVDLSKVWVEMSAFPENIERVAVGQSVEVYDLHQHERVDGQISYVSPTMTDGHIARARAIVENKDGHWRPGMHIKVDVQVAQKTTPLAVKKEALQTFRDFSVVFAKFGNDYEVRMLELGESGWVKQPNGEMMEYVEVLSGLKPNTEYVTKNSYILKADVLKGGASHDH